MVVSLKISPKRKVNGIGNQRFFQSIFVNCTYCKLHISITSITGFITNDMGVDILIYLVNKERIVLVNQIPKDLLSVLLGHLKTNLYTLSKLTLCYVRSFACFISPAR